MVIDKNFYMHLAIAEAWKYQGRTYPNPAVGCVIVGSCGKILAVEAHKRAGDPHAEVEALKAAYFTITQDQKILPLTISAEIHEYLLHNHNCIFNHCELYTTLEPCSHVGKTPSCADLISELGLQKVYVGSKDKNPVAACGNDKLVACGIDVEEQLLEPECDALLAPFGMWNQDRFIFFKWAQRLNGTFDDGTISSQSSRALVHAMRDRCDLLIIGGESVRKDRPTLDARLIGGKAPDVLIYSRSKEFDTTIPLFSVPGRRVIISDDISTCHTYKNIMIEGGSAMYEATKQIVDYYLCFVSPTFGGQTAMQGDDAFEILNLTKESEDIILWMKRKK